MWWYSGFCSCLWASMPGQSVWDLWWTQWHWVRYFIVGIVLPMLYTRWTKPGNLLTGRCIVQSAVTCFFKEWDARGLMGGGVPVGWRRFHKELHSCYPPLKCYPLCSKTYLVHVPFLWILSYCSFVFCFTHLSPYFLRMKVLVAFSVGDTQRRMWFHAVYRPG